MINQKVTQIANSLIGLTEKGGNSGFYDFPQPFIDLMKSEEINIQSPQAMYKAIGWKEGQSWCDYTTELILKLAYSLYDSSIVTELSDIYTGAASGTFKAFKDAGWEYSNVPLLGALCFWQKKDSWQGHTGIVTEILTPDLDEFASIEGNTSEDGSRNGTGIFRKENTIYGRGSLQFKGFIKLKEIL